MASFAIAVNLLLVHEGGYVNDPADRGGETKYGISKRSYPHHDIGRLTKQDAKDIYFDDFWDRLHCDQITSQAVANVFLDFAANAGVNRAIKTMQIVTGVTIDGIIGPITLGAINEMDGENLAMKFTLRRIHFYTGLSLKRKSQRKFLAGWIARSLDSVFTSH